MTVTADLRKPFSLELKGHLSEALREDVAAATVRLVADDGSHCSAAVLSEDGYLLTALHCVERCLLEHRLVERFKSPYIETLSFRTRRQPKAGAVCTGFSLPAAGRDKVELVHVGPGVVNFVDYHPIHRIPQAEFDRLTRLRGDFAILKASVSKPTTTAAAPLACAAIDAASGPLPGSALYAFGFPLPKRATKLSSSAIPNRSPAMGRAPDLVQLLEGRTTGGEGLLANPAIQDAHFSARVANRVESFHQGPGVRLAHLDIYPGMSGGPIVSDSGRLVGAVSGVVDETRIDSEFVPNNGVYTPISFIYSSVQRAQGPLLASKIFSCKINN